MASLQMKNYSKLFTGLVLCIFLIPIISTSIVFPKNDPFDIQTTLLQPLRGGEFISNSELRANDDQKNNLLDIPSSSQIDNFNQIGQISGKLEGTGVIIEDYVDNDASNVDSNVDLGDLSTFSNMQATDNSYANLSETASSGAITKVGTDTSTSGNAFPLSWSHTLVVGTNRMVVVYTGLENNGAMDIDSVTYGGQAMTQAVEDEVVSGFRNRVEIWYILEANLPSEGSNTVSISSTGTPSTLENYGICMQYNGVFQSAPEATDGISQTVGTTITNTISPSTDSWVLSAVVSGSNTPVEFSHDQGQVEQWEFNDASSTFAVAELQGGSGETSVSSTQTGTINRLVRVAASFKPAPSSIDYQMDQEVQFEQVYESSIVSEE
ncbi:MAG: hypothetical protein ACW99Q_24700, partial [Candidatus Kariarchaeaceae archaeon]